jgi:predicted ferric reductase/Ca2+-binding EF-hand superfamily protein
MPTEARPSLADARFLETLERAFATHGGKDGAIDLPRLKAALGLRSDFLARRVLAAFDLNGDGLIQIDEFVAGARRLVLGTDRDKLYFAFRVHDLNGDGSIDQAELYHMITLSLAENQVARRASQPPDRLANVLFLLADRNRDGKISFEELFAVIAQRPRLLQQMTRSEALWIAPNEDLLAWLDLPTERPSRVGRFVENRAVPVALLGLYALVNLALFAFGMLGDAAAPKTPLLMVAGRALGLCLDFNGALILVPVMRRVLSWLRSTWLGRRMPIDDAIDFHRLVGHAMFALGIMHAAAFTIAYAAGHASQSVAGVLLTSRGLTGGILLGVFAIMWVFSQGPIRRSSHFELFYFTHLLYVAWFALAIAHAPRFALFAGVPLLGFLVEQILRLRRRGARSAVTFAEPLRSGVTKLVVAKPAGFTFSAGDYVFLRVPSIARHEWHPFTISSAPEAPGLGFHIRTLGNWTSALRRRVEDDTARGKGEPLVAFVDGPYGSPSAHIFQSRFAVFIGAGIGVTPFASVLESLVLKETNGRKSRLERAHFFWLNHDQTSFEWFAALLRELEKADHKSVLDIHLCMTGGRTGATALGLELAREIMHSVGRTDIVTGLRTHTHMGKPDWEPWLKTIAALHAPEVVDVFFCGPPGLGAKLRPLCKKLGMTFREEKF